MGCGSSKGAAKPPPPPPRNPSPELDPDYCPAYYFPENAGVAAIHSRVLGTILGTIPDTPSDNTAGGTDNPVGSACDAATQDAENSASIPTESKKESGPVLSPSNVSNGAPTKSDMNNVQTSPQTDTTPASGDLSYVLGTLLGTSPRANQPGQRFNAVREMEYHASQKHVGATAKELESTVHAMSETHTIPQAREVKASSNLCEICEVADLTQEKATKKGDEWDPPAIDLGFLDEILLTDGCALCRLVSQTLRQSWTSVPERTTEGFRTRCFIPNSYSPGGDPRRRFWELNIMVSTGNSTLPSQCRQKFQAVVRLDHKHSRAIDAPDGMMQLAKTIDSEQCDPEYLQSLIRRCKKSHGSFANRMRTQITCDRPRGYIPSEKLTKEPSETAQAVFRVIDVANMCIVEAARDSSFVSLSYVWGRAPFLRLLKENFDALCSPNGLGSFDIPKTITDAMKTTLTLGEEYLWVDALCIIQDDPVDIAAQIGSMDQVYSNAVCTIVAAAGVDAHAGLAGIHRSPRYAPQHSESVKDLLLHSMGPTLEQSLHESTWWSRGWTYQEFCLSRRLIFFTPSRVFFSCASEHDSEDVVHEDRTAKHAFLSAGGPFQGSRSDISGDLRTRLTSRAFDLEDPVKTYKTLVRDYSARHLSYDSDVLNGVQGILRLLTLSTKRSYYVAGLPEHRLDTALLWFPVGPLTRRGPSKSGHPYPSWSWAGWKGGVAYEEHDFVAVMTQEVTGWVLETPEGQAIDLLVDQIPFSKLLNSKRPAAEADHMQKQRKDLYTLYESGTLHFTTQKAEFVVDLSPAAMRGYWPPHRGTKVFPILATSEGSLPSVAGSLLLSLEDAVALMSDSSLDGNRSGGQLLATFILISSTQRPWSFTSTGDDSLEIYDEEIYDFRGGSVLDLHVKRFGCNVLWVRQGVDGTHERVAVGQIHVDAWEANQQGNVSLRLA